VFVSRAENNLLGTIRGDGGTIVDGRILLHRQMAEGHVLSVGVQLAYQQLDGDVEDRAAIAAGEGVLLLGVVEWPDNELEQATAIVRWTTRL
jgi:hypothetical protein